MRSAEDLNEFPLVESPGERKSRSIFEGSGDDASSGEAYIDDEGKIPTSVVVVSGLQVSGLYR